MTSYLIDRKITCPDGTVRVGFTPEAGQQGPTGKGSWTIVSGTGSFMGLRVERTDEGRERPRRRVDRSRDVSGNRHALARARTGISSAEHGRA